jgi:hypothetical protein
MLANALRSLYAYNASADIDQQTQACVSTLTDATPGRAYGWELAPGRPWGCRCGR